MQSIIQGPWFTSGTESHRGGTVKQNVAIRVDCDRHLDSERVTVRTKILPDDGTERTSLLTQLFRGETLGADIDYSAIVSFRVVEGDTGTIAPWDSASGWTLITERIVRGWIAAHKLDHTLKLRGNYLDPHWPPPIWRGRLRDAGSGTERFFGYLAKVLGNEKSGRPEVLQLCGRELPTDEVERGQLWRDLFLSSDPGSRRERERLGRTNFIELERTHPVGTQTRTITVGPSNEAREIWTPHLRWVVRQWFSELRQHGEYSLVFTGKQIARTE